MSDVSSLSELARFVGSSSLSAGNATDRRAAVNAMVARLNPRSNRRSVTDLLAVVVALSARTRRMLMPPVAIDLDVFSPSGHRAVLVTLPRQSA